MRVRCCCTRPPLSRLTVCAVSPSPYPPPPLPPSPPPQPPAPPPPPPSPCCPPNSAALRAARMRQRGKNRRTHALACFVAANAPLHVRVAAADARVDELQLGAHARQRFPAASGLGRRAARQKGDALVRRVACCSVACGRRARVGRAQRELRQDLKLQALQARVHGRRLPAHRPGRGRALSVLPFGSPGAAQAAHRAPLRPPTRA